MAEAGGDERPGQLPAVGPGRIAYVGGDRQIHVVRPDGEGRAQLTWSQAMGGLANWGGSQGEDACAWPVWSPDDRWVACFQSPSHDEDTGPTSLRAVEVEGIEERELIHFEDALPIYARWSPTGARIAVLAQAGEDLELRACSLDTLGESEVVDEGVPLFFSWLSQEGREDLLVHVGNRATGTGRVVVHGAGSMSAITDRPGSFCTPLVVDDQLVYALGRSRRSTICLTHRDTGRRRKLTEIEGLLALVPPPMEGDERMLVGGAPSGEHTPYDGIWQLSTRTGILTRLVDEPVMAFWWDPTGQRVIYAVIDQEKSCLRWRCYEAASGEVRTLCAFWPSRDQLFYLHFFEQFAGSHPLISPDGRSMVFSGYPDPRRSADDDVETRIFLLDLMRPEGGPLTLAEGRFAVFSHR